MPGMLPPPESVGRQRHQAAKNADNVVGALRPEEGAMTAIMLNDEDAHEEPGGEHRQRQRHPQRYSETQIHRGAGGDKSAHRCRQLAEAPRQYRILKRRSAGKNVLHIVHHRTHPRRK